MSRPVKRTRPDLGDEPDGKDEAAARTAPAIRQTWDYERYSMMVKAMPEDNVRQILILASQNSSYAQEAIRFCYDDSISKEAAHVADFSHYINEVNYIPDKKYSSSSESREYEIAWDAESDIRNILDTIEKEVQREMFYSSKKSALQVLPNHLQHRHWWIFQHAWSRSRQGLSVRQDFIQRHEFRAGTNDEGEETAACRRRVCGRRAEAGNVD